jgi:hypothetical protein
MSKKKRMGVKVTFGTKPVEIRMAIVQLRGLADRLQEMVEKVERTLEP